MTKEQIAKACIKARGDRTKYRLSKDSGLSIGQIERIENAQDNYTIDLLNRYLHALQLELQLIKFK